jgi:hypothetical protein
VFPILASVELKVPTVEFETTFSSMTEADKAISVGVEFGGGSKNPCLLIN